VFQVQDQKLQGDDALRRLFKACHNPGQAESSFTYSKAALDRIMLSLFLPVIERRMAKRRPAQPDAMLLAENEVSSAAVDLICQDCFKK